MSNLFSPTFTGLYTGGLVPVSRAVLCVDCQMISAGDTSCPACTSKSVIPLRPILGYQAGPAVGTILEGERRIKAKAKPLKLKVVGGKQ